MPKSKTRQRAPRPDHRPVPRATPENALEAAALALTQASLELVREAELHLTAAARTGDQAKVEAALELHHALRSGSLGLYVAYCQLAGLPDPRDQALRP